MTDTMRELGGLLQRTFRRSAKATWRLALGDAYYRKVPTAKASRERPTLAPLRPMVDPVRTLGHAPRPRTGRGVGVRR